MKKALIIAVLALMAPSLTACGILFPSARMRATKNTPGFKAGYSDGCSAATARSADLSAEQYRDKAMYQSDANYRYGWATGQSACRPQNIQHSPNAGPVPDMNPGGGH